MKSEEGNKATLSHWPRLDTLFATQAWISLWRLPEAKASKKALLRVRCLRSVSLVGSKGAFVSSVRTTGYISDDSWNFLDDPCENWRVTWRVMDPKCQQWQLCNHQR